MARQSLRGKYNENTLQREIVQFLNDRSGFGCKVSRIKNGGTWDPNARAFRKNNAEIGIPDIIGCTRDGRAIFIEVKMKVGSVKKEQVAYLNDRLKLGAICGVAYDISDAQDIILDNEQKYPRKDRTFGPKRRIAEGTKHEQKTKREKASTDPLDRIYRCAEQREERAREERAREEGASNAEPESGKDST